MSFFSWIFSVNWVVAVVTLTLIVVYHLILKNWNYFTNRGVKFVRGYPVVGTMYGLIAGKESFYDIIYHLYNEYPNENIIGTYEMSLPVFIPRDPELVKQVAIQSFDHFLNHQPGFGESSPLLGRTLFFRKDQEWKDMRSTLSPAFTGNKMRMMFDLIQDSTLEFCKVIKKKSVENVEGQENGVYNLKDIFSRYANDIIATTAFGLKVNSVVDKENELSKAGKMLTDFSGIQGIKVFLFDVMPRVMKALGIQFLERKTEDFFRDMVLSTMNHREKNNVYRPDMIHLLMEARKGGIEPGQKVRSKYSLADEKIEERID